MQNATRENFKQEVAEMSCLIYLLKEAYNDYTKKGDTDVSAAIDKMVEQCSDMLYDIGKEFIRIDAEESTSK